MHAIIIKLNNINEKIIIIFYLNKEDSLRNTNEYISCKYLHYIFYMRNTYASDILRKLLKNNILNECHEDYLHIYILIIRNLLLIYKLDFPYIFQYPK